MFNRKKFGIYYYHFARMLSFQFLLFFIQKELLEMDMALLQKQLTDAKEEVLFFFYFFFDLLL